MYSLQSHTQVDYTLWGTLCVGLEIKVSSFPIFGQDRFGMEGTLVPHLSFAIPFSLAGGNFDSVFFASLVTRKRQSKSRHIVHNAIIFCDMYLQRPISERTA